ncbi:uncharacterized protein LOC133324020 [Musca vetustissima]|uniref:uncharacterized protein LOC133324020 n=1 Tax=Musca vetustissima TaxID=27455 RepID=UPI002AB74F0F|nr:uncharacterized protein LOC133324020 [Musca vetustissima]
MCINDVINTIEFYKKSGNQVVGVCIDIEKAYDYTNINQLAVVMFRKGYNPHIIKWIVDSMKRRQLELGKSRRIVVNGLPQGSGLSPLLFNIYTSSLHDINSSNIDIFQFADDFFLVCHDKSFQKASEILTESISRFHEDCKGLGLGFNMNKINTVHFSRRPKQMNICINGISVKQVANIKYLGLVISAGGSSKIHIDEATSSTDKVNNFLHILSGCSFGISPAKAMHFYKAFARAKLEYGASALSNLTKASASKIKTSTHKFLRRALGLIRSTPVPILYQLACELPPKYRFELATAKELVKAKAFGLPSLENIRRMQSRTTSYTIVFDKYLQIVENVATTRIMPVASKRISSDVDFFEGAGSRKRGVSEEVVKQFFRKKISKIQESGIDIFFTDGSVKDDVSGAAFLHLNSNTTEAFWVSGRWSSMSAEVLAFRQVAIFAKERNLKNIAILTDSLSGIAAVESTQHKNYLINEFIDIINTAGIETQFHYIPGHAGIGPNELVDQAAKNAPVNDTCLNLMWPIKDAICRIQESVWAEWADECKSIAERNSSHFL